MERACSDQPILIIEDEADTADSLALLLRIRGYRVEVARSGPEGLEVARAIQPGAILLDLGLPGIDGYEVATRLRAAGDFDDVPIVAFTGYGGETYRRRSTAAGIDHHLVKPAAVGEIVALLERRAPGGPRAVAAPIAAVAAPVDLGCAAGRGWFMSPEAVEPVG